MAAATTDRNTRQVAGVRRALPVAANTLIYAGTMCAVNSSGYLTKGATSAALTCVGVAQGRIDNASGAAAAITGEVDVGVFGPFDNAAGDAVTLADVGKECYMVDDQTVARTSNSSARSVAGKVWDVSPAGVMVLFA